MEFRTLSLTVLVVSIWILQVCESKPQEAESPSTDYNDPGAAIPDGGGQAGNPPDYADALQQDPGGTQPVEAEGRAVSSDNESQLSPDEQQPPPPNSVDNSVTPEEPDTTDLKKGTATNVVQPTLFTLTNTDTGFKWRQIPYREKYQWHNDKAPCIVFRLKIPDVRGEGYNSLEICIYREYLIFEEDTMINLEGLDDNMHEQRELKVSGFVVRSPGSTVTGRIVNTFFYGEVFKYEPGTNNPVVYVIEEIKLVKKLVNPLRRKDKIFKNILTVMQMSGPPSIKYNAVVTKGTSLTRLFTTTEEQNDPQRRSFLLFTTSHNTFVMMGSPKMETEDKDKLSFSVSGMQLDVTKDGSVTLSYSNKTFTFRPTENSMLQELGGDVETLRGKESAVTVSALSPTYKYTCLLPSMSFNTEIRNKAGYVCKVCLASDKSFQRYYAFNKTAQLSNSMMFLGHVIDRVSWIFRTTDWNADGHLDNIGLDWDSQTLDWNFADSAPSDDNLTEDEMNGMYQLVSRMDFSECCLGVAYTMKRFPGQGFAKSSGPTGGICALRVDDISPNTILISANNKAGSFSSMTEDQLIHLTAFEIAKAFGASPDAIGKKECDEFTDAHGHKRRYLMWPTILRDKVSPEEKKFSICSKRAVSATLNSCRSSCFDVDKHPFCGNGIVEDGEECDCGSEVTCKRQKCCNGRLEESPCRRTGYPCH